MILHYFQHDIMLLSKWTNITN